MGVLLVFHHPVLATERLNNPENEPIHLSTSEDIRVSGSGLLSSVLARRLNLLFLVGSRPPLPPLASPHPKLNGNWI